MIILKLVGLLLAFLSGLFFVVGFTIANKAENKEKLSYFAVSLAFVVMLNLIIFDLVPEVLEIFENNILLAITNVVLGMTVLKLLDLFIPDHHHKHEDDEKNHHQHNSHIYHIGLVTLISLLLHNIIEGIAIYGLTQTAIKSGILMCIGVALHNIPLGTEIAISLSKLNNKKISNKVLLCILTLSSLIGALIVSLFGSISELFLGVITCLTLGMIIYIALFELLHEIFNNIKHKETYYGIIIGIIIAIFSLLL